MKTKIGLAATLFVLVVVAGGSVHLLAAAEEYSRARVVRLSFTEGMVTLQRPDLADSAKAPVNTPIQEGFKLSTADDSYAEVEFENAFSTARLGQLSMIEFTQLGLAASGSKINRLKLDQGYATFHFVGERDDIYEVQVGETTLTPSGKSEFRTDFGDGQLRVEVFAGAVNVSSPHGSQMLTRNAVLDLPAGPEARYQVSQGITKDAWDEWVAKRDQQVASRPAATGPYSAQVRSGFYGWNDLSGYGDWGFVPGYGYGWFPSVSWGWAPYSLGRWSWYPGFGYTWISYEPWGWVPFHYGNWLFDPSFGWFWMPGGFGTWSPALVTWYQGPGWVGWTPRRITQPGNDPQAGARGGGTLVATRTGQPPCSSGRTCMTFVPRQLFENGGTVTPRSNAEVDLARAQGGRVEALNIKPTPRSLLPGTPVRQSAALTRGGFGRARDSASGGQRSFTTARAPSSLRASESMEIRNAIRTSAASPSGRAFDRSLMKASGVHSGRNTAGWNPGPRSGGTSSVRTGGFSRGSGGFSGSAEGGGRSSGVSPGASSSHSGGGHR
jgi:hypothetical protein